MLVPGYVVLVQNAVLFWSAVWCLLSWFRVRVVELLTCRRALGVFGRPGARKGKAGGAVLGVLLLAMKAMFKDFVNPRKRQPRVYFPPGLVMFPEETTGALTRRQSQLVWLFCSPLLFSLGKIA